MDDCSTDNTVLIVDALQKEDGRIRLLRSEKNYGVSTQMNRGIAEARGEYICRMDSDDISHTERLYEQLTCLQKHPENVLCTTDYDLFYANDGQAQRIVVTGPTSIEAIRVRLIMDLPVCGASFFAQRTLFETFLFDQDLVIGEDYDLFTRVVQHYPITNIPKVLYHYRKYGKSISDDPGNWKGNRIDMIRRNYLEMAGIRLEDSQWQFFMAFFMCRSNYKVDSRFFERLETIKRLFKGNRFFDTSQLNLFFRERLHRYLLSTKDYSRFAFKYVLRSYPSVFTNYSFKDSLRIFTRSIITHPQDPNSD